MCTGLLEVTQPMAYRIIRDDARSYFNVRSKADMSQRNLPHGTKETKKVEKRKSK